MKFNFKYNNLTSESLGLFVEYIPPYDLSDSKYTISFAYEIDNKIQFKYLQLKRLFEKGGELKTSIDRDLFLKVKEVTFREIERNRTFVICEAVFTTDGYLYLDSGKDIKTITNESVLYKEYVTTSKPKITCFGDGYGQLIINDIVVEMTILNNNIVIDSDLEDCYSEFSLENNRVTLSDFPILDGRKNTISINGGITKIEIQPNWRC